MGFVIGLLTFFIVLDCLVLILLVLMQLPKKEAGAGLAFGGAATDALFGAGSGNFLTKTTKYAAAIFFVLAMILSILQTEMHNRSDIEFRRQIQEQQNQPISGGVPAATPNAPSAAAGSNLLGLPLELGTNLPAAAGTNAPGTNTHPATAPPPK